MKVYKENNQKYDGTTLVEVILYTALTSAMLIMLSTTFNTYLRTRTRSQVREEVTSQGRHIVQEIDRELSRGYDFVQPPLGGSGSTVEIIIPNELSNELISISSGELTIDDGSTTRSLNTNKVTVTDFTVDNNSGPDGNKIITYSVTVSYAEGSALEFQYENTFYSSVSLKINSNN